MIAFLGDLRLQLRLHPNAARHPPRNLRDQVMTEDLLELGERVSRAAGRWRCWPWAWWWGAPCSGSACPWPGCGWRGRSPTRAEMFLFVVLLGIPLSMVAFGWLLYRLNALYEDMRGRPRRPAAPLGVARELERRARDAPPRARPAHAAGRVDDRIGGRRAGADRDLVLLLRGQPARPS